MRAAENPGRFTQLSDEDVLGDEESHGSVDGRFAAGSCSLI